MVSGNRTRYTRQERLTVRLETVVLPDKAAVSPTPCIQRLTGSAHWYCAGPAGRLRRRHNREIFSGELRKVSRIEGEKGFNLCEPCATRNDRIIDTSSSDA